MTRFARAKGSKSSNERVPDEATPWNVMKMQLESSQTGATSEIKKGKNAKQLLSEKDELFYLDTTGNVNHEWAEFDDVLKNGSKKDEAGKVDKMKGSKKNKSKIETAAAGEKLHRSNNHSNNDQTLETLAKTSNGVALVTDTVKSKSKKKKKSTLNDEETDINSEKIIESRNVKKRTANEAGMNSDVLSSEMLNSDEAKNSDSKNKKRAKKSKKFKSGKDNNPTEIDQVKEEEKHNASNSDGNKLEKPVESAVKVYSEKLSKRQKRNQKKQMKIISEKNEGVSGVTEHDAHKEQDSKSFDVQGNDWSNEVKFGRQKNPRQLSGNKVIGADNNADRNEDTNNIKEKRNKKKDGPEAQGEGDKLENGNPVPKDSNASIEGDKKKEKRKGGKNEKKEYKRRKPDEGVINMIINGNEVQVVKYDGFPVKKEDADRLQELKKKMIIKGIPRSEINVAMKLERRKAEKALARERKRVCFHCRKSGHNLSDCPELGRDEAGTGICFKCGSAEHTHFECKVVKAQEFRHASCFICREQGHIARQCPDNPKGLYPQGGSCKICGDVTHLKKDCPDVLKEKEETNITADKITGDQLEALQEDRITTRIGNDDSNRKNKIVKF